MNNKKTEEMEKYEKMTGKHAIWRGVITEGFKKWQRGEKIYDRFKERIALYVAKETKEEWQNFIKNSKYTSVSKLVRDAVNNFIEKKLKVIDYKNYSKDNQLRDLSDISHVLKEALTSIKGYSQLLIENYKEELNEEIILKIKEIFDKSIFLENKINESLEYSQTKKSQYDILLIEDDISTIKLLTSFFERKGYSCKGVISGSRGLDELKRNITKIILLDIILPDINGFEVCKIIKSNKEYQNIPIFLLTAVSSLKVEHLIKKAKADGYISKPFDLMDFNIILEYLH